MLQKAVMCCMIFEIILMPFLWMVYTVDQVYHVRRLVGIVGGSELLLHTRTVREAEGKVWRKFRYYSGVNGSKLHRS